MTRLLKRAVIVSALAAAWIASTACAASESLVATSIFTFGTMFSEYSAPR